MTETKATYTPGPWTLETVKTTIGVCHKIGPFPASRTRPDRPNYACVYEDGMHNWRLLQNCTLDSELLANARLIAAAPALVEALKGILDVLNGDLDDDQCAAWDQARAALQSAGVE